MHQASLSRFDVIRKAFLLFSAAALALPLLSGSSPASTPKVDAAQYTVHCDSVVGTVGFAPPLSATGAASPDVIKLKATLSGTGFTGNRWAPAPDGQRFLLDVPVGTTSSRFAVVSNWATELEKR